MKTILFTATALSLTGAALANGNEWSALDREVEALASSLVDNHDGIQISGYADIWYRNQADSKYAKRLVTRTTITARPTTPGTPPMRAGSESTTPASC
jgi:pheromone shutdown protein TraB